MSDLAQTLAQLQELSLSPRDSSGCDNDTVKENSTSVTTTKDCDFVDKKRFVFNSFAISMKRV